MKRLPLVTAAALSAFAASSMAQNATTVPVGAVQISLPAGKSTMICIPMIGDVVYSGVVGSLSSTTITVAGSPWGANEFGGTTPFFVLVKSGLHSGRMLRIASNTASTLTLDTDDNAGNNVPLNVSGKSLAVGDKFQITEGTTLGSLFGTSVGNLVLTGATRASSADNVGIYDPLTLKTNTYFFNTTPGVNCWVKVGSTVNQNNLLVWPGQGLAVSTLSSGGTKSFTVLGTVPDVAPVLKLEPTRSDRIGTILPVDLTLSQLNLGSTWKQADRASSADTISIYDSNTLKWVTYYKKLDNNWYQVGSTAIQNSKVIPAGSSFGITTITSNLTGSQLLYPLSLPYSL